MVLQLYWGRLSAELLTRSTAELPRVPDFQDQLYGQSRSPMSHLETASQEFRLGDYIFCRKRGHRRVLMLEKGWDATKLLPVRVYQHRTVHGYNSAMD